MARELEELSAFFGVSSMQEAIELRQAGLKIPILVLGHTPVSAFRTAILEGIRPAIFCYEDAVALSREARRLDTVAPFHFALDTGMSRIGFQADEENADICAKVAALPGLEPEGLFSHFATADCADLAEARAQQKRFDDFSKMLEARGVKVQIRHLNNSAGLMNFENHYDMVRAGIVVYGMYPSDEVSRDLLQLRPALSWHSRITHLKTLPAGRGISYGACYVTTGPTVVATVPVGYADGYRRSLSNRFYVLIRGRKAPILGRVCMDQLMVDVTQIPDVRLDDSVTLIGTDGENTITVEEIAECAGSFHYEMVCGISRRVPRFYVRDGRVVNQVHYLLDT